ncbi:MAG: 4-aminobutyrate--2-oxoglutarate transaminase [Desulfobacterales bacterium]|nr:4-aminobutyrate--2-oxoglutarate transaminase [Desulfobacterales bacterium]
MSKNEELLKLRQTYVPRGPFNATTKFAASAKGATIVDVEGNEYIDFVGGIGVMNVGHSHPKVIEAIKAQADKFTHTCFHIFMYESYVKLAEKLCNLAPGNFDKMAMFANSGAEADENAIKIARYATKRPGVICFETGFHGRTLLTMTMTSKVKPYKFGFGPLAPEVYRMPYGYCYRCPFGATYPGCNVQCADHLKDFFISHVAAEQTAALIVEPVTGEGGFITPPPEYFPKLLEICRENGIVFIADEVQSGAGRTGKMFAMEHWGIEPDMITCAKSFAAGMPISAVIGKSELMNAPHVGGLGGTYGGNPVACESALAVLEMIEEGDLLQQAEKLGVKLRARFDSWAEECEVIGEVRGLGPMLALELVKDRETKEPDADSAKAVVSFCMERGLLLLACGSYGNVIRTLMPLTISDDELERGLAIMEEAFKSISK